MNGGKNLTSGLTMTALLPELAYPYSIPKSLFR
jgi:hypothetical protein